MSQKKVSLSVAIVLLSTCVSSFAAWTEPYHLSELNTTDKFPSYITASNDGSVIFYNRAFGLSSYCLWESRLNPETGMYENERRVTELGPRDGNLTYVWWMSEDIKRMYSSITDIDWNTGVSIVSRRADGTLYQKSSFPELQKDNEIHFPSLTADELNIMFIARGTSGIAKIFTASRSVANEAFGNIRQATEFIEIGADFQTMRAYMSLDGLSVYFDKLNDESLVEIWKGTRESLDEQFGNFKLLSDIINMPGTHNAHPCLANDGKTLYFVRGDRSLELSLKGIYVSYWVETPYETAVRVIKEAIAEKEDLIEQLDATIAKENEAVAAFDAMLESGEYEGMSRKEILTAKKNIHAAIIKQKNARRMLSKSLKDLRASYSILVPMQL